MSAPTLDRPAQTLTNGQGQQVAFRDHAGQWWTATRRPITQPEALALVGIGRVR